MVAAMGRVYTRPLIAKPSSAQIEYRRDLVVELTLDPAGYWLDQIATALRVGKQTITKDRTARAHQLRNAKHIHSHDARGRIRPPAPEPRDWTRPPAQQLSAYATGPVPRLEALLAYLKGTNARNRHAHNVEDAAAAGDSVFFLGTQVTIAGLIEYLQDLQEITQDGAARRQAATSPQARDDLKGPARRPGPYMTNLPHPLPPPASGKKPGRMFAELWGYKYAGLWPLSDEEVLTVASRSGGVDRQPNTERVRQAIAELDAYWESIGY